MSFSFARRIRAFTEPDGLEVDAVTYEQFMKWDQPEKDQYLIDNPKSSFRHKLKKEPGYVKPPRKARSTQERNAPEQPASDQQSTQHENRTEKTADRFNLPQGVSRRRIRDPYEGPYTELTLPNGKIVRLQKHSTGSTGGLGGWHDIDNPGMNTYVADNEDTAIQQMLRKHMPKEEPAPAQEKKEQPASEITDYQSAIDMVTDLKKQGWKDTGTEPGKMLFTKPGTNEVVRFTVDPKHDWTKGKPNVEVHRENEEPKLDWEEVPETLRPSPVEKSSEPESPTKPLSNPFAVGGTEDTKAFASALRKPGATFEKGKWEASPQNRGYYRTPDGNVVSFNSITTYSKSGRLRIPGKTKYQTYATIYFKDPRNPTRQNSVTIPFGVSTGESSLSDAKMKEAREKAQRFAQQKFGIELGPYDFSH
jgi:hypothetical protein